MTDAIVEIRTAVRAHLQQLEAGDTFLVAVSGGADSLALAYALKKESEPLALQAIAVTIDHQLQSQSTAVAEKTSEQLRSFGYTEVLIEKVDVSTESGIEAGARDARYQALSSIAKKLNAARVFLGHTRDDQAETVLLGLARGSGTRSLSGMAIENGIYLRPLLAITREQTEKACKEIDVEYWNDPHNINAEFSRVRVREEVLPIMEEKLGPGIAAALARSARLLRDDADALDDIATSAMDSMNLADLDATALAELPRAIRSRILRSAIYAAGAPTGSISAEHVAAIEALVTSWHGQGALSLPGGVKVERISGRLSLSNP
ncbi:MAG: tRNA lysidine(34) synthetase TilS [Actinobacteria bacterium]|uniref:tRNA(Ile)-lysidine synthetase n=1 Tax=freshwater metagenome TaxID=449393 RepID=A0A6J5Z7E3_9ZZZZ|nr:tRNA lysidine(34) synthetase TilS [Actinomycetota bacterium]